MESIKIGFDQALFIAEKMKVQFVYNMAKMEGNTATYAQAETIVHGMSVSGLSMRETRQIDNIHRGLELLLETLRTDSFSINKFMAIEFNMAVAEGENRLGFGGFRNSMVAIGGTDYVPPMHLDLPLKWDEMVSTLESMDNPVEQGMYMYMTMARNQFFGDGNKRTALLMMNGILIKNGYCPITISPVRDVEYRDLLLNYYENPIENKDNFYKFLLTEQSYMLKKWGHEPDFLPNTDIAKTKVYGSADTKRLTFPESSKSKEEGLKR